jgi:hypothetical protein
MAPLKLCLRSPPLFPGVFATFCFPSAQRIPRGLGRSAYGGRGAVESVQSKNNEQRGTHRQNAARVVFHLCGRLKSEYVPLHNQRHRMMHRSFPPCEGPTSFSFPFLHCRIFVPLLFFYGRALLCSGGRCVICGGVPRRGGRAARDKEPQRLPPGGALLITGGPTPSHPHPHPSCPFLVHFAPQLEHEGEQRRGGVEAMMSYSLR